MRKLILLLAMLCLFIPSIASATDTQVYPKGAIDSTALQSLVWGSSGAQGFNNNFFFVPTALNESVCIYVYNNNPSNAHTFTVAIAVTGNPQEKTPSDGTWQFAANSAGLNAAVSPGLPAGIGASVSGAALVSLNFSASSTLGGSPDTANVVIVQTSGNCFSGNQFIGSAPQTVSAVSPLQAISDGLSQAFIVGAGALNPGNGQLILHVNAGSGARTIYFQRVILTTNVAAILNVLLTSNQGTTCPAGATPVNTKPSSSVSSTASISTGACATNPTSFGASSYSAFMNANSTQIFDLSGDIATAGSTTGVEITISSAVTGTVGATILWYEK